jgi:hypothetical protein
MMPVFERVTDFLRMPSEELAAFRKHFQVKDLDFGKPEDYEFFDWQGNPLPRSIRVGEIPKPGIILIIKKLPGVNIEMRARFTEQDMDSVDVVRGFLMGTGPHWEPPPVAEYDVFLSYAYEDSKIAHELETLLRTRHVSCFLAEKSIQPGALWSDEVRYALTHSRRVLLLLTPHALKSHWIMCERRLDLDQTSREIAARLIREQPRDLVQVSAKVG